MEKVTSKGSLFFTGHFVDSVVCVPHCIEGVLYAVD